MALHHMLRAAAPKNSLINYIDSGGSTVDGSSFTFNSVNFGSPTSTREVFIIVNWRNTVSVKTLTSATIGGVTATVVNINNGNPGGVALAFATVNSGTTGTVVFNLSGTAGTLTYSVFYTSGRTNTGQSPTNTYGNSSTTYSSPLTTSVVVPANGFSIGAYTSATSLSGEASSPYTLANKNSAASAESTWMYAVLYGTSGTISQSFSWSGGGTASIRYGIASFNG